MPSPYVAYQPRDGSGVDDLRVGHVGAVPVWGTTPQVKVVWAGLEETLVSTSMVFDRRDLRQIALREYEAALGADRLSVMRSPYVVYEPRDGGVSEELRVGHVGVVAYWGTHHVDVVWASLEHAFVSTGMVFDERDLREIDVREFAQAVLKQ